MTCPCPYRSAVLRLLREYCDKTGRSPEWVGSNALNDSQAALKMQARAGAEERDIYKLLQWLARSERWSRIVKITKRGRYASK